MYESDVEASIIDLVMEYNISRYEAEQYIRLRRQQGIDAANEFLEVCIAEEE